MTEHGPTYNVTSPALAKHRAKARNGLAAMTYEERQAYGAAVEKAILAMQAQEARRALVPGKRCGCASGTWHSDGAAIHEAIREQQRRAALAAPSQIRRARSDVEWATMYEQAMQDKAKRIANELWEQAA